MQPSKIADAELDLSEHQCFEKDISTSWNSGSQNHSHIKVGGSDWNRSNSRWNYKNRKVICFNPPFANFLTLKQKYTS